MTDHYISTATVLAFYQRIKATEMSENARPADHTLPRLPEVYRMPITVTSVLRTGSAAVVLATVFAKSYKQHSSVYLVTIIL